MSTVRLTALSMANPTALPFHSDTRATHRHSVQFYEDDSFLLDGLSRYIGGAIAAGDSAIAIATQDHLHGLCQRLQAGGLDIAKVTSEGRLLCLDAAETLARLMVEGEPDATRFQQIIGNTISQLASSAKGETRRVAAFGEMVALLWAEGKCEAAIHLEQLWNQLAQSHSFQLHCAYPLSLFSRPEDAVSIQAVCSEHSHVAPAEGYTALQEEDERLRAVALLQQKAQALEKQIQERDKLQIALREREAELTDFLENAIMPMHCVALDGTIMWANAAELALTGLNRDEYVGHNIREFHVDEEAIQEILLRLARKEELRGYKSRLRCKDGSTRIVRIYSNVLWKDEEFVHTRCFTLDVTERERSEQRISAQLAVTRLLADSGSHADVTERLLETMCEVSQCALAALWRLDEKKDELYCARIWAKPNLRDSEFANLTHSIRFRIGEGLPGRVWKSNQPVWIADLRLDDNLPRKTNAINDGLRSAFAFPIAVKGRVQGIIEFFSSQVRQPDDEFMNMMGSIGIQMGQAISRRQSDEARMKLAAIVESSDDGIVSKDLNGIVTSWNAAAERIFGYRNDEIVGRSITLIIPPELQDDELMILSKIRSGQRIEHFQTVRLRKDGTRIDVSLTISPIKDEDGRIIGAAKIARDITQQKRSEQAALQLAAIVESSDDAIVSKNLDGIITSWNKGAERIFGYTADEIVGEHITRIIPQELQDEELHIIESIKAGKRIDHFQTERVKKDGERVNISLTISPLKNPDGKIIGAAKIARDITQHKKLEAALHTSEKLASVGRLAATVAHEINNPLEAVTNYIYLAKQQPELSERVKRYLESADRELSRVSHIAQQTLGFYRDNSRPVPLVIAEVIDDVLAIYERKFSYKDLVVQRELEPGLSACTLQGELKQVLSNIVSNAIDASNEGGKIIIRARSSHDYHSQSPGIRITVADRGVGISPAHREKIFTPFFSTKKEVGTGLGLWITKDLLEKKGGRIHFRSRQSAPSGTVMSLFLPMAVSNTRTEVAA